MANILVVEDHAMSRQVLSNLLGYTGHRVLEAAEGMAAIALARSEHPDLIISDIFLPTIDGIEFVRRLRTDTAMEEIPIIFYTATCRHPESLNLDETCGNYRVIPKPSDPYFILQTVNELLGISPVDTQPQPVTDIPFRASAKSASFKCTELQLPVLMELSYNLVAQRDPNQLLNTISRTLRDILNCGKSILAVQEEDGIMRFYSGHTECEYSPCCPADLLPPADILERVVTGRTPVRWKQMSSCAHLLQFNQGLLSFESLMVIPFASPGNVYGWICLRDKLDAMLFSERDEEIALTLITQAALAYENILLVEQLKNSNEAKSMFIANISHELRTPLNILLSSAQLLNSYIRNDVVLDRVKIMKKINMQVQNCYRLLRLVNNLIDITKIDSDHFDLKPAKCNIVEIVEAISQSVVEYARIKEIDMVFDTEEEEMLLVCDLDSIERIILNLLSNAIKFTPEGGNIHVSLRRNKSCVQISIRDTGIGICKDKLDVIFERFKQVDNLMTRKHEGSGIGLSLVKLLTELHGGQVYVFSEHNKGSEFIVELPISMAVKNDIVTETKSFGEDVIKRIQIEFSDIYFN